MGMQESFFGLGAYTTAEAAKLLHIRPANLRRWVLGYDYKSKNDELMHSPPLWSSQYDLDDREPIIGFRDLIEARVVYRLKNLGLSIQTIRACLAVAREIAGDTHPFSTQKLKTDGKRLYLEVSQRDGGIQLIDLKQKQHAFSKIIEQTFVDLDFDDQGIAERWWIYPTRKTLVIDPDRAFGQAIAADSGVPTSRIAEAVKVEGSALTVAKLFDLPIRVVNDAVKFEAGLLAAA